MNKSKSYVELVLLVCWILTSCYSAASDQSCSEEIAPLVGKGSMGGWSEMSEQDREKLTADVADESDDLNLKELVLSAIQTQLKSTNDLPASTAKKLNIDRVFTQVVAGTNYCITFTASFCHGSSKQGGVCQEKDMTCDTQLYKPLPYMTQGSPASVEVKSFACK